jgi:hypothetical protein
MTLSIGAAPATDRITYGNLRRPRKAGVMGMSMAATGLLFAAVLIGMAAWVAAGPLAGLLVATATAAVSLPLLYGGAEGRTGYERIAGRASFRWAEARGYTTYISGLAGATPDGATRLPGLAADSELVSHRDAFDRDMGVICYPDTRHYAVVIEAAALGDELVDQPTIDARVRQWGAWLASHGRELDLAAATVVIETAPDPGTRLATMVAEHLQPEAPTFSRDTLAEVVDSYPQTAPSVTTRIVVTFSGQARAGQPARSRAEALETIALSVPSITDGLRATGAGLAPEPMTAAGITDAVRVAYDPAVGEMVAEAQQGGGTGLSWSEVGPTYAREYPTSYRHEGAASMVWQMAVPPAGQFYDDTIKPLLAPDAGIARKRVALVYRAIPAEEAAKTVQADVNAAHTRATGRTRRSERDEAALAAAQRAAAEEAAGAGLSQVGLIVSATVTDPGELEKAAAAVGKLAGRSRLRLRPARYNQAASFAAGLPIGIVLPAHVAVPDQIRQAL